MKSLAKKLVAVIGSVSGKVKKSGYNSHQKYNYVMESDLLDAIRPELVAVGLAVVSSIEEVRREGDITTVRVKNVLIDSETGETLEVWSAGQGSDKQDKGIFKAITGANKYFMLKTFMLSGDDDPESDGVAAAPKLTVTAPKPASPTFVKPTTVAAPATLKTTEKPKFNVKPPAKATAPTADADPEF